MLPRKIVGVEQVDDTQTEHTAADYRPLFTLAVFTLFTVAALIATEVAR